MKKALVVIAILAMATVAGARERKDWQDYAEMLEPQPQDDRRGSTVRETN